jgi:hypothetical protein
VRHWTLDECLKAGRITPKWAEDRKRQWGETSPVYQNRVLGEFSSGQSSSLIPLSWVEEAVLRWQERYDECGGRWPDPIDAIGVDCAWTGEDKSVLAAKRGNTISEMQAFGQEDPMQVTGRVIRMCDGDKTVRLAVDVIGIGAGVYSRLKEQGYNAVAFNAAHGRDGGDRIPEYALCCLVCHA